MASNNNYSDQTDLNRESNEYFVNNYYPNADNSRDRSNTYYSGNISNPYQWAPAYNPQQVQANPAQQSRPDQPKFFKSDYDISTQQQQYVIPDAVRAKGQYAKSQHEQEQEKDNEVKFVIHKVDFSDTLEGLSLQYGVSAMAIKKYNNIDGDYFYHLKELKIPNPNFNESYSADYDEEELEKIRRQQKLDLMYSYLGKDRKGAQYYLEENGWNVEEAYKNYRADLDFEAQYDANQKMNNGLMYKKIK